MKASKYFSNAEFKKLGCTIDDMDADLLYKMDKLRALCGIPLVMTSAYRTQKQNTAAGGASNSAHLRGKAVDIKCMNGTTRFNIVNNAIQVGFRRIGIGKNFVHLDNDNTLPWPVIFHYY